MLSLCCLRIVACHQLRDRRNYLVRDYTPEREYGQMIAEVAPALGAPIERLPSCSVGAYVDEKIPAAQQKNSLTPAYIEVICIKILCK